MSRKFSKNVKKMNKCKFVKKGKKWGKSGKSQRHRQMTKALTKKVTKYQKNSWQN
jgi:hypothetical protein